MKIGLIVILFFNVQLVIAQSDTSVPVTVTVGLGIDRVKERETRIDVFVNAINTYRGGMLPKFLLDECFDLQSHLWDELHSPVSLRWKVLERVTNKQALKLILNTREKRLKTKCAYDKGSNPEIAVPMIEKSFYQLLRERYEQLKD